MKKINSLILPLMFSAMVLHATDKNGQTEKKQSKDKTTMEQDDFKYFAEQFADIKIIRYQIPSWDKLTLKQKELVYYLYQAGLSGRDMVWDQNYRHNLEIRHALETIINQYQGDKTTVDWNNFIVYAKRVFFSNGIHHHYSNSKFLPEFSRDYFSKLQKDCKISISEEALKAMFDPKFDAKKVNLDPEKELVQGSAVNFYSPNMTEKDVDSYYANIIDKNDAEPISYGLNSQLVKNSEGTITENVWKVGGMYSKSIEQVVYWLEKAVGVSENNEQAYALKLLIEYYKTGDLKIWDDYNIAWSQATEGDIDYIQGFVEVYNDPKGFRGSYESIVQIKDFEASERMKVLMDNVQWFEDNSSIQDEHKKKNVVGVTYKVVNVAGEAGDASPSTPIGVNLPNANWIRAKHGSKSVSLGNIVAAYDKAGGKGALEEFVHTDELRARAQEFGALSGKLHTALHEVVGHASGKINPGIGTPKETLKSYASTLEEGRADLVALYYLLDPKMVELGLMPSLEVGRAEYDSYIRNGMMLQLRRLELGENIEEAHMRNRQLVASWCYEKGLSENVVEKISVEGKTYFVVNDYEKLRALFGELLREIQRIKSEGDYEAGRALVENYGVKVDPELHKEVLERAAKLESAPYGGFINPRLVPLTQGNKIVDIKVEYPEDFLQQMLEYGENYGFLH